MKKAKQFITEKSLRNFQRQYSNIKPEILKQLNDINLEKCLCYIDKITEKKKNIYETKLYFNIFFFLFSSIILLSINHFNQNKSCSIK